MWEVLVALTDMLDTLCCRALVSGGSSRSESLRSGLVYAVEGPKLLLSPNTESAVADT